MANTTLSEDFVFDLIQSEDQFPVDFDAAWNWLGYSRKSDAKESFRACGFLEALDYEVLRIKASKPQGGRPAEKISIKVPL